MNTTQQAPTPERKQLIRCKQVMAMTGITSRSTLYRWIAEGRFCPQVKIGPRASAWYLHEVQNWIDSRSDA
jgi:prophage regulatory protein